MSQYDAILDSPVMKILSGNNVSQDTNSEKIPPNRFEDEGATKNVDINDTPTP